MNSYLCVEHTDVHVEENKGFCTVLSYCCVMKHVGSSKSLAGSCSAST